MLVISLLGYWYWPDITYKVYLHHSKSLPFLSENFVGREKEIEILMKKIDFYNRSTRIVNIYGPPGFGKSTLAIHLGHEAVREGVEVHYVNMIDFSNKEVKKNLGKKILKKKTNANFDLLLEWLQEYRFWYYQILLIFDNCDDVLHNQREEFQGAMTRLVESSLNVKLVLTSREIARLTKYFDWYKLDEITTPAANTLLELKVSKKVGLTTSQREQIIHLTGNVPLALQIVSSLFNFPISPSPTEVIQELNKDIIHFLSPKDFPADQKLLNSIGLSIKYLTPELLLSSCYLVVFPGSFDDDAANAVLTESIPLLEVSGRDVLSSLIKSSLLEKNERTLRYQYHRLIRKYFMALVDLLNMRRLHNMLHTPRSSHRIHYSQKLTSASNLLKHDHKTSLSILYTEEHNFRLLLDYLRVPQSDLMTNDIPHTIIPQFILTKDFLLSVVAVSEAINTGLFRHRFTMADWCEPIKNSLIKLDKLKATLDWYYVYTTGVDQEKFLSYYVLLIKQLAMCQERSDGLEVAVKVYTDRENIVEMNKWQMIYSDYMAYYDGLAGLYSRLSQEENFVECHRRVIHKANVHLALCNPGRCSNYVIGSTYYGLGEKQKAVEFLEKSLKENQTTLAHSRILVMLYLSYSSFDHSRQQSVIERLVELQDRVVNVSNSELYHDDVTLSMINIFRKNGFEKEASLLEDKLLEVILEIHAQPQHGSVSMDRTYEFAQHLFNIENYSKVIDIGTYILESLDIQNPDDNDLKLRVGLLIGKAKFLAGNYSEGMDDIETALLEILNHTGQGYAEEKKSSCWYLIPRMKYINICYNVKTKFIAVVIGTTYLVLGSPLDYPQSTTNRHSRDGFGQHESYSFDSGVKHDSSSRKVTTKGVRSLTTVLVLNMEEVLNILLKMLEDNVHGHVDLLTESINHTIALINIIISTTFYSLLDIPLFCFLINIGCVWVKLLIVHGLLVYIRHPLQWSLYSFIVIVIILKGNFSHYNYGLRIYIRIIRDPRVQAEFDDIINS